MPSTIVVYHGKSWYIMAKLLAGKPYIMLGYFKTPWKFACACVCVCLCMCVRVCMHACMHVCDKHSDIYHGVSWYIFIRELLPSNSYYQMYVVVRCLLQPGENYCQLFIITGCPFSHAYIIVRCTFSLCHVSIITRCMLLSNAVIPKPFHPIYALRFETIITSHFSRKYIATIKDNILHSVLQ